MFKKILIANRGEIAVRIIRTCREMGIETVAVYSEADAAALHVLEADRGLSAGAQRDLQQSYLNIERLLQVARRKRGRGDSPGLRLSGRKPGVRGGLRGRRAGLHRPAGRRDPRPGRQDRGPPHHGSRPACRSSPACWKPPPIWTSCAGRPPASAIPLLVKAAAGGGGKGMRFVVDPGRLCGRLSVGHERGREGLRQTGPSIWKRPSPARATWSFRSWPTITDNVVHLFERECSIQRRHQKIVEETPSPALTPGLRQSMARAAVEAALASGYATPARWNFCWTATAASTSWR